MTPSRFRRALLPAILAALALATAPPALAQPAAGPPPLLDRALFFGDAEVSGTQLSPDGAAVAFVKPFQGARNVWVVPAGEPFEAARPVTADRKPVDAYFWSADGQFVLYVQDKGGDENFRLYAVAVDAAPEPGTGVPPARDLTPVDGVQARIVHVPRSEPGALYVALNDRDPQLHDLYRVDLATGERRLVMQNPGGVLAWTFDGADRLRLASRVTDDGDTEVLRVTPDGTLGGVVYACSVEEACGPEAFHPDGRRVYLQTNRGDRDLLELVLLDPDTGEEALVERDPEGEVDFGGMVLSRPDRRLVGTVYDGDRERVYWSDPAYAADYDFLRARLAAEGLAGAAVVPVSRTEDDGRWLVLATSDTDPGAVYLFDRDARTVAFQYRPRPGLPAEHLAARRPVRYRSSDGLEIPAYLTLPQGLAPTRLPVVVVPHGGPWHRDSWGYDPWAQFLANRGYAVLQPNFRGSTGYGKAFLNAGNGEWGRLMQDDVSAGVRYLVGEGIADPERVAVLGASYGGYATLAGLAFTPELYAAGVDIFGVSSIPSWIASFPAYWRPVMRMVETRVGDVTDPADRARLEAASPLFAADRIVDPLLVVQGANDPRVPKPESDQIVAAVRDRVPVEYLVFDDEGHGFSNPANYQAAMAVVERFLARHIGGRHQPEVPAEIATRLAEVTVDPASVVLPDAGAVAAAATAELPGPVRPLPTGTARYAVTIAVAGQEIPMTLVREVREDGDAVVVDDRVASPMGAFSDVERLDRATLRPRTRRLDQGPAVTELAFGDGAVTGTVTAGGQSDPVDVALGAPVLGGTVVLGALPLAEGFGAVYRQFDLTTRAVEVRRLTVEARETVEVPAGRFETFRVVLRPADGAPGERTLWVTDDGRVVKETAVLPEMNGAVMTMVLSEPVAAPGGVN